MGVSKTSLSAGEIIAEILLGDDEIMSRAQKVYPVVEDTATLPYIVYQRVQLDQTPVKQNTPHDDNVGIQILCFTEGYTEGVELAEAVRAALDGIRAISDDGSIQMRDCVLTDSSEGWQSGAYVQELIFKIRI